MVRTDFYVMAIFALLIFAIGLTFTKAGSKNGQAFFEAGGATPWWINGLSLFISYFSAGTFVVWGSIAYKSGLVANVIQLTMAISGLLVARFIAGKWKKTGAVTAADYLGKRFGVKTQQFYTYLILLLSLFSTAAVLYPVGKMVHVATLFPLNACIIVIGLIIVLYTAAGGLWAVLVTDVVQFVILSASVLIVIPIAFSEIGGVSEFFARAPPGFFQPFNADYTFEFMLAFIVYQLFYIGGNWAYVQRYTSVATVKESKKVAYLFTILYLVSPVIWMLPPMIYRIINPDLQGLEPEGAYMMICQKVLPAGLIGLVLAGMVSATSSKANTTINLVATVFANDIYKPLLRPRSSDKELILMARLFTLLFGAATIIVAILIPRAGGVVEVVLSTASIAGGALFGPIIWSLFTRRQTAFSLVSISIVSLLTGLFFKVITPSLFDLKFNRTVETIVGVGLPVLLLFVFELYSRLTNRQGPDYMTAAAEVVNTETMMEHAASQQQNIFGVKVIAISMAVIGIGIVTLGVLATSFSQVVIGVGLFILIVAVMIWYKIKPRVTKPTLILLLLPLLALVSCKYAPVNHPAEGYENWTTYAGTKDGSRYSAAEEITLKNVAELKVAWVYSSHDKDTGNQTQNQCNPIIIGKTLYGSTPTLKLFALDAASGRQKWLFDPASLDTGKNADPTAYYKVNRGVVYWQGDQKGGTPRIFYNVGDKVFAIDAADGRPVLNFGSNGYIDLNEKLGGTNRSFVAATTPGIIYKDLLIMGLRVSEGEDASPAPIRAYDTLTGKLRWTFNTIPHPGEKGYETWEDKQAWKKLGGANNWAGMSLDENTGVVYIPTGAVGGDFYGANRKGQNLYANSLIALHAATGKYIWHYQVVHHDLWDRDLPANPNLVTLNQNGKLVDAVAQITKHGYIFLFNRTTGIPIFPIVEKPVPQTALPGEHPWPTQPIPTLPEPFARQVFGPAEVTDLSRQTHKEMMERYMKVKYRAMFSPPSKEGGWIFPGFDGGGEWGGAAVDQETKVMYINATELPWIQLMIDVPKESTNDHSLQSTGHALYNRHCISCHGEKLMGNGSTIPGLTDLNKKHTENAVLKVIENGRNMMPSFKALPEGEKKAILAFLLKIPEKEAVGPKMTDKGIGANKSTNPPYAMAGYTRFLDKDGYPGIKPPWGTLNAVNLQTGKLLWKVPLGEYPELTKRGIPVTGTENYGGPLVTKGGLVFIAATKDEKIRAFDKTTGKLVWQANLPAAGYATPACYQINGKQYIVIACGGGKIGSKSGDEYVAFSL